MTHTNLLNKIKQLPIAEVEVDKIQLHIGKHSVGNGRKGIYRVSKVKRDPELAKKLRDEVVKKISDANEIRNFEPLSEDQDDAALSGKADDTEWSELANKIDASDSEATSLEDLIGANFYVVEIVLPEGNLYAVRKLGEKWTTKRVKNLSTVFSGGILKDAGDGSIFRFDRGVDFIFYKEDFLILNKKNFEKILNFREGMLKARDQVLEEIEGLEKFDGLDVIKQKAEDKMPYLRRLATVRKSGYFREQDFMDNLFEVVRQFGWDIKISQEGKIVITPENVDAVLHLLNNDRVESVINKEMYDAIVKKKIG